MASLGQCCGALGGLAVYGSSLPAAVCSSPFIPAALLISLSKWLQLLALGLCWSVLVAPWLLALLHKWSLWTFPSGPWWVESLGTGIRLSWEMRKWCLVLSRILAAGFLGQPQDSFLASLQSAACDVPLEEKHAVSVINGLLEKKTELSKVFDVLNISLIFHLFLNDLRQTLICCCWPLWLTTYIYWMDVTLRILACIKFFPSQQKDVSFLMSVALPITGELGRRWQCPFNDSLWLNGWWIQHTAGILFVLS